MSFCFLALVAIVVPACGSDAPPSSSGLRISTLASNTINVGTARFAGARRLSDPSFTPNPSETSFTGELDFVHDSSSWVGTTKQPKGEPRVSHSLHVDGFEYYETPDLSDEEPSAPPPEKPWARVKASPAPFGFSANAVSDVASVFNELERWGGQAEEVGAEEVRGVPTTHYRFEFPAQAVPQQLIAMGTVQKPKAHTWEIWADADHRLRRLVQSSKGSPDSFMTEYFDFGVPVAIDAPPTEQVMEAKRWELTGAWALAQQGRAGDVDWKIYRAPEVDGGVCLAHESKPNGPFDDIGIPKQRGHAIDVCTSSSEAPEPGVPLMVDAGFQPGATALANRMALLYGSVDPGTTAVTLRFEDGHTERVTPKNDTFAAAIEADDVVKVIEPALAGHEISCRFNDADSPRNRFPGYLCTDGSASSYSRPSFPSRTVPGDGPSARSDVPSTAPPGDLPDVG